MLLTLSPKKYGRKISLAARKSDRSKLIQLYCCFSFMLYWIVGVYVLPEAVFSVPTITTCGRYVWFRSGDESSKVVFTSGQVYVHRIPVTTSSVTTSNRLLWANNFQWNQHLLIDHNVKKFSYNEHPGSTSTFLCIKLLVVSGTQCTCLETANTKVFLHISSVSSEYVLE